jgi:hypothetical protein
MAHQTHSLPWNTLASNFKYRISHHHGGSNRECLPLEPDIWPLNKPNQEKELAYFTQAFVRQIQEFSNTERAKYPPQEDYKKRARTWIRSTPPTSSESVRDDRKGKKAKQSEDPSPETRDVISPELMKHYEEITDPLYAYTILYVLGKIRPAPDKHNSKIENWLLQPGFRYNNNIPKGDTTKLLIMEASGALPALGTETSMGGSIESLLLMSNHPQIDILSLKKMSWGHHFGVSRVAEEALKAYIYVNLLVAMMEKGDEVCDIVDGRGKKRKYMDCDSYYKRMLYSVAGYFDGDAQSVVHRVFFFEEPMEGWKDDAHRNRCAGEVERDILSDLERLREYLKGVWRLMVIYDLVIREAGGDPDWENECKQVFAWVFKVRYEYV